MGKKLHQDSYQSNIMDERLIAGYIMAITGFVMLLINALSYIFHGDLRSPAFTILGLILIVIGARTAQRSSWIGK